MIGMVNLLSMRRRATNHSQTFFIAEHLDVNNSVGF